MSAAPEPRYTTIGEFRLHSVHAGAGPPVMLLHGFSGSHRWWRYTLPPLAASFQVHVPELIGFGASRAPARQPDIPHMAELLVTWLDQLAVERTHLVGHSMGGQIAIHIAARWPARVHRLVLAAPAGIPRALRLTEVARFASELLPPRAWGALEVMPLAATDALRAGPRVLWHAARHLLHDDVRPLLARIASPTLLIWGEHDALVPVEHGRRMQQAIAGARLVIIGGAAHTPMVERREEFNAAVVSFLSAE